MKTADIVVGQTYALAQHSYQLNSHGGKRACDKVVVREIGVERTRHGKKTANGIRVEFQSGRNIDVLPRAILMPWDEYEAEEKANVARYTEVRRGQLWAAQEQRQIILDILGVEQAQKLLPYGYDATVYPDGSYSTGGAQISLARMAELLTAAYESGRRA